LLQALCFTLLAVSVGGFCSKLGLVASKACCNGKKAQEWGERALGTGRKRMNRTLFAELDAATETEGF
jgi:hypothetical protein